MFFNLLPVFLVNTFVTLDGGAHGYNTNILHDLLFNDGNSYGDYFKLNHELVPNLTSHIIFLALTSFLPYAIAEKILVASFLLFLPIFYRRLVLYYQPSNTFASYLIIPFTHYSLLYLGFYNFSIALVLMLACILYWLKNKIQMSFKNYLLLFCIFTLIYFSHVFVFAITLLFIGFDVGLNTIKDLTQSKVNRLSTLTNFIKTSTPLAIIASPFLVLMFLYFKKRPCLGHDKFLTDEQIFRMFKDVEVLVPFNEKFEEYSAWFFYGLSALFVFILFHRIKKKNFTSVIKDTWLILSTVLVWLLFKFPDDDGYAGYISIRFVILFYIFILIWLSIHELKPIWYLIIIVVFCYPYLQLRKENRHSERSFNIELEKTKQALMLIKENKTLVSFNFSDNWLAGHFANYLATDKNIIVLDNYEAYTGYFPVSWNYDKLKQFTVSDSINLSCLNVPKLGPNTPKAEPDYVHIYGNQNQNECYSNLKRLLDRNYIKIYQKDKVLLFKRK